MAIPKSTFVMGVVTLGLFGVAIYQTSGKKGDDRKHAYDDDDELDDDDFNEELDDEELAEYQRREAERERRRVEEEAARAAKLADRKAALRQLFGAEVALPGPLFRGVTLDSKGPLDPTVAAALTAYKDDHAALISIGSDDRLDDIQIQPGSFASSEDRDALCDELHGLLGTAWGSAYVDGDGVEVWTNDVAKVRAAFVPAEPGYRCQLLFDKFDPPKQWLNRATTSTVPLGWIGKPAQRLAEAVGGEVDEDVIAWRGHGVGVGTGPTSFKAFVANGKVSYITAQTVASAGTRSELVEHMTSTFGKPKSAAESDEWSWPAHRIALQFMADNITLTVGKK